MNDQRLQERANQVEAEGVKKYGAETWATMVGAIGRLGATPEMISATLQAPDAVDRFARAGREGILADLTSQDTGIARQAERIHTELRDKEREAYRRSRGR